MKKILLVTFSIIFSSNLYSANLKPYYDAMDKCDKTEEKYSNESKMTSTTDLNKLMNGTTKCYYNIAVNVIDTFYKNSAQKMKSNLSAFIKTSFTLNQMIYENLDSCEGDCGTLATNMTYGASANDVKNHVKTMLSYIETMDE